MRVALASAAVGAMFMGGQAALGQCERLPSAAAVPLVADPPVGGQYFGRVVAISGDSLVVSEAGNNHQRVVMFAYAGGFWTQQASFQPFFAGGATSAAMLGTTAVVGDSFLAAVEVYNRSGTTWAFTQELTAGFGGTHFGESIGITSLPTRTVLAIGGWSGSTTPSPGGAVYVFTINPLLVGATWGQSAFLFPNDSAVNDRFGTSVGISGTSIIAGAPGDDTIAGADAGSAYVFTGNNTATTWTQQVKLTPSDAQAGDGFGTSVAISGDTAAVGVPYRTAGNAVYIFTRIAGVWSQLTRIDAPYGAGTQFGASLALQGDRLVIGAPAGTVPTYAANTGYVAMYSRPTNSGVAGGWSLEDVFPRGGTPAEIGLGTSVAITSTPPRIAVGAPAEDFGTSVNEAGYAYVLSITRPCPQDFNCSGGLEVQDVFDFLNAWFATDPRTDFDGVNGLQVADIFAFLNAWFAGCP